MTVCEMNLFLRCGKNVQGRTGEIEGEGENYAGKKRARSGQEAGKKPRRPESIRPAQKSDQRRRVPFSEARVIGAAEAVLRTGAARTLFLATTGALRIGLAGAWTT
ncbi:hypothetical protein PMI16_02743 [Herbaspirillum sp. CF444]|nr:hypothetical protein PMI16_02743 [Herbaspirillum sp. CF444]